MCGKKIKPELKFPNPEARSVDHLITRTDIAVGRVDMTDEEWNSRENVKAAHLGCNWRKNRWGGGEQLLLVG